MPMSVTIIIHAAARRFGVSPDAIRARGKTKTVNLARAVAMYVARSLTELSYPELGKIFGRDHSTVISAVRWVEQDLRLPPPERRMANAPWIVAEVKKAAMRKCGWVP